MADYHSVIAIDMGHTRNNYGSKSARGRGEFHFNQVIAKKLYAQLQQYGYKNTFIINPKGNNIKLRARTKVAQRRKADLFISIHHDSMQLRFLKKWKYKGKQLLHSERFKGFSLFISQKNQYKKQNLRLAHALAKNMLKNKFTPTLHHAMPIKGENRKLIDKRKGIYAFPQLAVLRTAKSPAILVECGVIVNKDEELLLRNNQYQNKISKALADGIVAYLKR